MKSWSETTQMKATDQYFPMALFIILCKVVLTFESADEILKCSHFNESYWAVLFCVTVCYAVKDTGSNFWVCGWNSNVWPFKWKRLNSILLCRDVRYAYLINVDFSCGKQRPRRSWSFNFLPNRNGLQGTWKVKMKENQNKS